MGRVLDRGEHRRVGVERRRVDHDDSRHRRIAEHGGHRPRVVVGTSGRAEVDDPVGPHPTARGSGGTRGRSDDGGADAAQRVAHEQRRAHRVRHDRRPRTARERLLGEQPADVDHLAHGGHAHHPGPMFERFGGGSVAPGQPGPDGDERFDEGEAAGHAPEATGIAVALDVEQGDGDVGVVRPVVEQVGGTHVGGITERDERGDAEPDPMGELEHPGGQRPGLHGDGDGAGRHVDRTQRGVHRRPTGALDDAEAPRTDEPHALPTRGARQLVRRRAHRRTGRPVVEHRDDERAAHAPSGAGVEHTRHLVGRDRDDGEVDVADDRRQVDHGRQTEDRVPSRVHRVDVAGEAVGEQRSHDASADGVVAVGGTEHGDRPRVEKPGYRRRVGPLLASFERGENRRRDLDRELEIDDPTLERAAHLEAGPAEHREHRPVLGQHLGGEAAQAVHAADRGEMFEQHRAETAPLVGVDDGERHLGLVMPAPAVVATDGDDLVAEHGDEGHAVAAVDVDETVDLGIGQARLHREEPVVDARRRQPAVEGDKPVGVVGADRPHVHRAAVAEHDVDGVLRCS